MQTFLPEADFAETAKHLDRKRLIKQSVENLQVRLRKIQNLIIFIMNTQTTVNLDTHVAKHVVITGQLMWRQSDSY